MTAVSLAPLVSCRVILAETPEPDPVNAAIASMMLSLREGRHFHIEPGRIQWHDEHDHTRSFFNEGSCWYASDAETWPDPHPMLPPGEEADFLQNMIDHLLTASLRGWTIRGGRRPDPEGHGNIGFIAWDRQSHGNVPRLEVDPDGVITYWHHWPEPDLPARERRDPGEEQPHPPSRK